MPQWLDAALAEYRLLQEQAERAYVRQRVELAVAVLAMAVLLGVGIEARDGSLASLVALVAGVPIVAMLATAVWSDEQERVAAAQLRLSRLASAISAQFPLDPPPVGVAGPVAGRKGLGLVRGYRIAVTAILVIALGAAAIGIVQAAKDDLEWALLGVPVLLFVVSAFAASRRSLQTVLEELVRRTAELDLAAVTTDVLLPGDSPVQRASRDLHARESLVSEYGVYTPDELFAGSPRADELADRLLIERRAFALDRGDDLVFPRFQFSDDLRPLPAIGRVLATLGEGEVVGRWQVALWFTTENPALGDRRPVELLGTDPDAVVRAAASEFGATVA